MDKILSWLLWPIRQWWLPLVFAPLLVVSAYEFFTSASGEGFTFWKPFLAGLNASLAAILLTLTSLFERWKKTKGLEK